MNAKFSISAVSESENGSTLSRFLYRTNDMGAFERVILKIADLTASEPKLRSPVRGNARRVKILTIDAERYVFHLRAKKISPALRVGQIFDSIAVASRELGLAELTLAQFFTRARRAQKTNDPVVSVRGFELGYADAREHKMGE